MSVSTNVTFNATTSTQTVDIPILNNMIVAGPTVFSVALTSNDTAAILNPASADITVEDEDSEQVQALQVHIYPLYCFINPFPCIISVVTIGFDPATYTVNEGAGNVSVTVNVLNGTLARDMRVRLMTSLSGGTANGN